MLSDYQIPNALPEPPTATDSSQGFPYRSARWSGDSLADVMIHLAERGPAALADLGAGRVLAAWNSAAASFRDPESQPRRDLAEPLRRLARLSPRGLDAGLEAVLGGVSDSPAERLFAQAEARPAKDDPPTPAIIVLASNLPALAVQPLLPALALGRPVLVKSPSSEPLFAPAFVAELARLEPLLGEALAAVTWKGGHREIEDPLLAAAGKVIAYGDQDSLLDLEKRAPGKVHGYGPKTSVALISADVDPVEVAEGLARDMALFDQRGCLSVAAIFSSGTVLALGEALSTALADLGEVWPPGPAAPAEAAGVRQMRAEAELRALIRWQGAMDEGTVVLEPREVFVPTPGLRAVRIHPMPDLDRAAGILAPWKDRLQGAALAGEEALATRPWLEQLGVSRFAAPGDLQSPDALWHNGGVHPLDALAG